MVKSAAMISILWPPKCCCIGRGSYRAYLRNIFMYFHLLLRESIPSYTKHPYRSVPSLNCRYCTAEILSWRLLIGITSRLKKHKFWLHKNQTHGFRTSGCAGHLLDHSGDEGIARPNEMKYGSKVRERRIITNCQENTLFPDKGQAYS